jgi:predicted secreted Zn-dependent protease
MNRRPFAALALALLAVLLAGCTGSVHVAAPSAAPSASTRSGRPSPSPSIYSPVPHSPGMHASSSTPIPPTAGTGSGGGGGQGATGQGPSGDTADNGPVKCSGTTDGVTDRGVQVHTRYTCYTIHGSTLSQLNAQMDKLGPKVDTSGGHAAATKWKIIWSDSTLASADECKITSVNVRLGIVFEFPDWQRPTGVSTAVAQEYDTFLKQVGTHEYTHRKIAIAGADKLDKALSRIAPKPNCDELTKITDATAKREIDKSKAQQVAFDAAEAAAGR